MISCDHCGMTFKYNCHLEKHLSRKFPCFSKPPSQFGNNNTTQEDRSKPQEVVITTPDVVKEDNLTCKYCLKTFSRIDSYKRHISDGCKMSVDDVRCLEVQLNKQVQFTNNLTCRFCKQEFAKGKYLKPHYKTCKKRKEYKTQLEQDAQNQHPQNVTINNNNINITNNVQIVNWSNETYEHMTPETIANIIRKCMRDNKPLTFFSEFPTVAHQGVHSNIKLTNLRANYVDICEDGKFFKLQADDLIYDCTKKMIYRLDDAFMENEQAFKNIDKIARSLVRMEEVVDGIPKEEASEAQLLAMQHLNVSGRSDIVGYVKNGIRNAYILSK